MLPIADAAVCGALDLVGNVTGVDSDTGMDEPQPQPQPQPEGLYIESKRERLLSEGVFGVEKNICAAAPVIWNNPVVRA